MELQRVLVLESLGFISCSTGEISVSHQVVWGTELGVSCFCHWLCLWEKLIWLWELDLFESNWQELCLWSPTEAFSSHFGEIRCLLTSSYSQWSCSKGTPLIIFVSLPSPRLQSLSSSLIEPNLLLPSLRSNINAPLHINYCCFTYKFQLTLGWPQFWLWRLGAVTFSLEKTLDCVSFSNDFV